MKTNTTNQLKEKCPICSRKGELYKETERTKFFQCKYCGTIWSRPRLKKEI